MKTWKYFNDYKTLSKVSQFGLEKKRAQPQWSNELHVQAYRMCRWKLNRKILGIKEKNVHALYTDFLEMKGMP